MSDAFVYMFVVASGASSGVAVVAYISYKIFKWREGAAASKAAAKKNRKRGAIV